MNIIPSLEPGKETIIETGNPAQRCRLFIFLSAISKLTKILFWCLKAVKLDKYGIQGLICASTIDGAHN